LKKHCTWLISDLREDNEEGMAEVKKRFDALMKIDVEAKQGKQKLQSSFLALRRLVLFRGIGAPTKNTDNKTKFRGQLWKLMTGVLFTENENPVDEYLKEIKKGKATVKTSDGRSSYEAIRDDSFRTMKGATLFDVAVEEPKIIRVLNSYVQRSNKAYNQGMNTILCPFLVCMNELDAFHCFYHLLEKMTPTYWMSYKRKGIGTSKGFYLGARAACRLADKILREVDPELHESLMDSETIRNNSEKITDHTPGKSQAEVFHQLYTFRHMQVFSLVARPLGEVIKLWDLFFALGMHVRKLPAFRKEIV